MKYNKKIHKRKSIRLKNYDYTQEGLYFITICVNGKINLFGEIIDAKNKLNDSGYMVESVWKELENKYQAVKLHEYIVMPNHFHGIIEIKNNSKVGADLCVYPTTGQKIHVCPTTGQKIYNEDIQNTDIDRGTGSTHRLTPTGGKYVYNKNSLSEIIKWFKVMTTNKYIKLVYKNQAESFHKKLWQRNFYEHIIRNENSYLQISEYIKNNPKNWEQDTLYN